MASDHVDASVLAARAHLKTHFAEFSGAQSGEGWQKLWEQGDFLPWDRGIPNPALADLLEDPRTLFPVGRVEPENGQTRRKTALVPGCGRGVDVLLLKSFGYDAVGLEVSRDAVKACRLYEQEHGHDEIYRTKNELGQGTARYVVGDFFAGDWIQEGIPDSYDLIYDYTFFCALEPSLRPRWASRMSELLGPRQSSLVCIEFPTYKSTEAGGPPFAAPPEAYFAHLTRPGEPVVYEKDDSHQRNSAGDGLERVAHFHPARTHRMGMDEEGRVRDYISVWRHVEPSRAS